MLFQKRRAQKIEHLHIRSPWVDLLVEINSRRRNVAFLDHQLTVFFTRPRSSQQSSSLLSLLVRCQHALVNRVDDGAGLGDDPRLPQVPGSRLGYPGAAQWHAYRRLEVRRVDEGERQLGHLA